MTSDSIENATPAPEAEQLKSRRKFTKKPKATKKQAAPKKKADGSNKRAEVIALMKRTKGATLPEIMKATGWQAHMVRGFVSILGSKAGKTIESSKSTDGQRTYRLK